MVGANMRPRAQQKRATAAERKKDMAQSLTNVEESIIARRCVRSGTRNTEAVIDFCVERRTGPVLSKQISTAVEYPSTHTSEIVRNYAF